MNLTKKTAMDLLYRINTGGIYRNNFVNWCIYLCASICTSPIIIIIIVMYTFLTYKYVIYTQCNNLYISFIPITSYHVVFAFSNQYAHTHLPMAYGTP